MANNVPLSPVSAAISEAEDLARAPEDALVASSAAWCHFDMSAKLLNQQFGKPGVVVTPAMIRATDGGIAAQVLARLYYWCSPRQNRSSPEPIFRTFDVDRSDPESPIPWWRTTYRGIGEQLGISQEKARRAVEKLIRRGLVSRESTGSVILTLTQSGWRICGCTHGPLSNFTERRTEYLGLPTVHYAAEAPDHRGQSLVYVPTAFVLICGERFDDATLLSHLCYWVRRHLRSGPGKAPVIWKTTERLIDETGFSRDRLLRIQGRLCNLGFIEISHAVPRGHQSMRRHFRIVDRALDAALNQLSCDDGVWSCEREE